jgi:hypothetical protein
VAPNIHQLLHNEQALSGKIFGTRYNDPKAPCGRITVKSLDFPHSLSIIETESLFI